MVPGTGILLNNEMDDFAAKAGAANAYGLVQGEANTIAPGRRPLSSMTPTLVFKNGEPWLAAGSPGGSLIITTVLQTLLNAMVFDMNIATAVAAPACTISGCLIARLWNPASAPIHSAFLRTGATILQQLTARSDAQTL